MAISGSKRFIAPARRIGAGKPGKSNLSVIIPAAGPGNMRSIGCRSLININGKPLIQYQISSISDAYPEAEIIAVLGFEIDKVVQFCQPGTRIVENEIYDSRSVVSSIRLAALNALNRNLLIVYGDLFFSTPTIDNLTKDGTCVVFDSHESISKDSVGVNIVNNEVEHFTFGVHTKWAQIAFIHENDYPIFFKFVMDKNNGKLYLHEIFNMMIDKGVKFGAVPSKSAIIEVDYQKDMGRL